MRRSAYGPSKGSVAPIPRIGLATGLGASRNHDPMRNSGRCFARGFNPCAASIGEARQSMASAAISTLRTAVFLASAS